VFARDVGRGLTFPFLLGSFVVDINAFVLILVAEPTGIALAVQVTTCAYAELITNQRSLGAVAVAIAATGVARLGFALSDGAGIRLIALDANPHRAIKKARWGRSQAVVILRATGGHGPGKKLARPVEANEGLGA